MGNDEGGGPTRVAKVRAGAERSRRAASRHAELDNRDYVGRADDALFKN